MRAITLVTLMTVAGLASLTPRLGNATSPPPVLNEHDLREACSALSQAGMRDCLARKVEESQANLKRAEKDVYSRLSKWDESSRYARMARSNLANSGRAFTMYRDAQCGFSASLTGGGAGNAHEIRRLACVAAANGRRAEQLREAVSDLPIKSGG